jgi:hypothetical protein
MLRISMVAMACLAAAAHDSAGQCVQCRISVQKVATLGNEVQAPVGRFHTVARLPDGRYALSYDASDDEVLIFEADGRFVRRIGRAGEGPGEFRSIRFLRSAPKGFAALDPRLRRVTFFNATLAPSHILPLELTPLGDALVYNDTTIVINAVDLRRDRIGPLAHVVTPSGIISSFAADPEGYRFDLEFAASRLFARSPSGIWIAERTRYRISEYTVDGQQRQNIERRVPWFEPHVTSPGKPGRNGPAAFIIDIQEQGGLLWVMIAVADRNWRAATEGTSARQAYSNENGYFDTIIEVLDSRTGAFVASTRVDEFLAGFHGPLLTSSNDTFGTVSPTVGVWRLELVDTARG